MSTRRLQPAKPSGSELAPSLSNAVAKSQQGAVSPSRLPENECIALIRLLFLRQFLSQTPFLLALQSRRYKLLQKHLKKTLHHFENSLIQAVWLRISVSGWLMHSLQIQQGQFQPVRVKDGPFGLGMMRTPQGHNAGRPIARSGAAC